MNNKIIDKRRSIGVASKEVGLEGHVLRFWEKEFPQIRPHFPENTHAQLNRQF